MLTPPWLPGLVTHFIGVCTCGLDRYSNFSCPCFMQALWAHVSAILSKICITNRLETASIHSYLSIHGQCCSYNLSSPDDRGSHERQCSVSCQDAGGRSLYYLSGCPYIRDSRIFKRALARAEQLITPLNYRVVFVSIDYARAVQEICGSPERYFSHNCYRR